MSFESLPRILYYPSCFALIVGLPLIFTGLMIFAIAEHVYWYAKTKGTMIVLPSSSRPQDPRMAR